MRSGSMSVLGVTPHTRILRFHKWEWSVSGNSSLLLKSSIKWKMSIQRFATCSEELNDFDSIYDWWILDPVKWWANHGQPIPMLQKLALKLLNQPASSSCCERNWSTYSFIHSKKRNKLTPERAEDLVFIHNNLRLLSRKAEEYKSGPAKMWDIGDGFESLSGIGILEVPDCRLMNPWWRVSFDDGGESASDDMKNPVMEED